MFVNKTSISNPNPSDYTLENQQVLRNLGSQIVGRMGKHQVQEREDVGLWDRICRFFPSSQSIGARAGEHLAITYGAQWSNATIDFVVSRCLRQEREVSTWSWEGTRNLFFGAVERPLSETLKLTLTPKAMPYITLFSGTAGSIALPAALFMISLVYQQVMHSPEAIHRLSQSTLEDLLTFTLDEKSGRLRDGIGRLLTIKDTQRIFEESAKYQLICNLIDLCRELDLPEDYVELEGRLNEDGFIEVSCLRPERFLGSESMLNEDLKAVELEGLEEDQWQVEMRNRLNGLLKSYVIKRDDGKEIFSDGTFITTEVTKVIQDGLEDLCRVNFTHDIEKIQAFIQLAVHSVMPFETFSSIEEGGEGQPKRILPVFSADGEEWKNAIVRTVDGKYVVVSDFDEKKIGTIIDKVEMGQILNELHQIQQQKTEQIEQVEAQRVGPDEEKLILKG